LIKTIFTDCDGVLLDWKSHFLRWVEEKKGKELTGDTSQYDITTHIKNVTRREVKKLTHEFDDSTWMVALPSYSDAVKYVKKLYNEGWTFIVITSLSDDPYSKEVRRINLNRVFGEGVFSQLICLPHGADKDDILKTFKHSPSFWIEDKPENAEVGASLGFDSILIKRQYNKNQAKTIDKSVYVADGWKEIYTYITSK